jgi:hypothetical protein
LAIAERRAEIAGKVSNHLMPYTSLLLIICCAVFYYRVGESDYGGGGLLALVSVTLWLVGSYLLGFGWLGNLLVQLGLFFALTAWNVYRHERR